MTLHIHRAERADALVRGLGALLAAPPEDPFTPDVVAVPSKGVERWITQTLAARWMCSVMDRPLRRHLDAGHDPRSWPGQFPDLHQCVSRH